MRSFGLIGYPLDHSFSPAYFQQKFDREHLPDCQYATFPLQDVAELPQLIASHPQLEGLNVTIPYKQAVIPLLDNLDPLAQQIGAVNTISINRVGDQPKLKGWNTDIEGFSHSLKPLLGPALPQALILGTGGASLAIRAALDRMGISWKLVSRQSGKGYLTYPDLAVDTIRNHRLIINTTPVGTYPDPSFPQLPYAGIGPGHLLYDLVYNPAVTPFLQQGLERNARIKNGLEMLEIQAEAAWRIWNQGSAGDSSSSRVPLS